jgi:P27 family predicted phage terminase small subunit
MSPARRKSSHQHLLEGTYRPDRVKSSVVITGTLPRPSSWLSKEAKREFKRVLKILADAGQDYLSGIDTASLEAYAVSYSAWVESEKQLQRGSVEEVPVFNRATGNQVGFKSVPSPWLRISKDRLQSLLRSISALGFDPRSRNSIAIPEVKAKGDSIEDYLNGGDDDAPVATR